jgi:hypothetical protein
MDWSKTSHATVHLRLAFPVEVSEIVKNCVLAKTLVPQKPPSCGGETTRKPHCGVMYVSSLPNLGRLPDPGGGVGGGKLPSQHAPETE